MISIKCFGMSREIAENGKIALPKENMTVKELRQHLEDEYGHRFSFEGFMIAVNHEYAMDDTPITSADEVAIIPPVSGG